MSGTDVQLKAYYQDTAAASAAHQIWADVLRAQENGLTSVPRRFGVPELAVESLAWWDLRDVSHWNTCLSINLYGKGDVPSVCRILDKTGARLVAVDAFNDQVGEAFHFGWISGKEVKKAMLQRALAKHDPMVAFRDAIAKGNAGRVKEFIKNGVDIESRSGDNEHTPLMLSAYFNRPTVLRQLLAAGADIDAVAKNQDTALFLSVKLDDGNSLTCLDLLLHAGADTRKFSRLPDTYGGSIKIETGTMANPLMLAARAGAAATRRLIAHRADVNARNELGQTALMFAAEFSGNESAIALIAAGADVNAMDKLAANCLDYTFPSSEMDWILRNAGARSNPAPYSNKPAIDLLLAIEVDDRERARQLLNSVDLMQPITVRDESVWPLVEAIRMRRIQIAEYILAKCSVVEHIDAALSGSPGNSSLMHIACKAGRVSSVKLLFAHGATAQALTEYGQSAMDSAFESAFPIEVSELCEILKLLLAHGAPLGKSIRKGITSKVPGVADLYMEPHFLEKLDSYDELRSASIEKGDIDFVRAHRDALVRKPLSLERFIPNLGENVQQVECAVEVVVGLLRARCDPNEKFSNVYYSTPLNVTMMGLLKCGAPNGRLAQAWLRLLDELLMAGALPDGSVADDSPTLLMKLQRKEGMGPTVEKLIKYGADVNRVSTLGPGHLDLFVAYPRGGWEGQATALMLAALNGRLDYVKQLVSHGADLHFRSHEGTIMSLAQTHGRDAVVRFLRDECGVLE